MSHADRRPQRAGVPPPAAGDHPRRDAWLVAMFVVSLAAAALGTYMNRNLAQLTLEKRAAEPWPASAVSAGDWLQRFERAFGDRFGGRERLARAHHALKAKVLHASPVPNVLLGSEGWLYFLGEDGRALDRYHRGTVDLGVRVSDIAAEFARRHDALAARGIAYVVAVVPDKFSVHDEFLPRWVVRAPTTPLDRLTATMRDVPRVRFVDLRGPLLDARAVRDVYYRTDSHWNVAGAAVGYHALMDAIRRGVPDMPDAVPVRWPTVVAGERYSGDLASMLGAPKLFAEDDAAPLHRILSDTGRCATKVEPESPAGSGREVYACPARRAKAVFLRDSMAIPLIPLVAENFARSVWLSTRRLDLALIDDERPDVVIDQLVERSMAQVPAFPMAPVDARPDGRPRQ